MGLMTGLVILILQRYMSADAVHQLLTFNPADFFTYAGAASLKRSHSMPAALDCHLSRLQTLRAGDCA